MIPFDMRRSEAERFWEKVDKSGECWEWTAYKLQGYGRFGVGGHRKNGGRIIYAHRWAYEALIGPIPDGLTLDHLCRNRGCVNPDHLEPVTPAENTRRGGMSLRTHCPQGHEYTPENTYHGKTTRGSITRVCRECSLQYSLRKRRAMGVVPKSEWTHCKNGHEWTDENTYWATLKDGYRRRSCRACTAAAQRRYQARKREQVN